MLDDSQAATPCCFVVLCLVVCFCELETIHNSVVCFAGCKSKPALASMSYSAAVADAIFPLHVFVTLRKKIRRIRLKRLRRYSPHLESDFAHTRVHQLESMLSHAAASKKPVLLQQLQVWRSKISARFPPPDNAFRALEYQTWEALTIPELKLKLQDVGENPRGCKRKSDYLHRLNEWARRNHAVC